MSANRSPIHILHLRSFVLAIMAALAMLAVFTVPAQLALAQSSTALVSNVGQTSNTTRNILNTSDYAQGFVTGDNAGGYTLASIEANLITGVSSSRVDVDLYSFEGGNPGTKLHDLTDPNAIANGNNTFTAPAGVTLAANTRYFVVFTCSGGTSQACIFLSSTNSDAEDSGAASGWSIQNRSRTRLGSQAWSNQDYAYLVRVNGEAAAATTPALVSNIGHSPTGSNILPDSTQRAQGFTTGSNAEGYTLASIDVNFASATSAVVVDLYSASGSNPGTRLFTLTDPNTVAAGINTFTAPAGTTLTANTTYFVVMTCSPQSADPGCAKPQRSGTTSEESGAAMGWSIDDNRRSRISTGSSWSSHSMQVHLIRVNGEAIVTNVAPVFSGSQTSYVVAENSTTVATLTATDADSEDTARSYALSGADAGKFTISTSGALAFSSAPNHEDPQDVESTDPVNAAGNNQYIVTVTVTSGTGDRARTADRTLRVTVTDVSEKPGKPATPTVSATTETSVTVGWTEPANTGPDITQYQVRRVQGSSTVTATPTGAGAARSHTFSSLSPGVAYAVSVRAYNGEDWSDWSDAVSAPTTALPSITIARKSTTAASVAEGTTPVFVVTASRAPSSTLTVKLKVAEATGRDFVASTNEGNKNVTISTTETSKEFSFATVNDNVDEPNGVVTVTVVAGTGYTVGSTDSASVTITDNDATPTVTLVLTPSSINESGSGNRSTVTASLNRASSQATTVTVSATAVSPAVSGDFNVTSNKRLTIAAGSTTSTGTVRITAVNNSVDAANKSVTISATATNSHAVTAPTAKTLTIADDDTAGVILSRTTTLNVPEAGSATYSVKLASQPTANVIITPDGDDDTAATVSTARSDNTLVFTTVNWATNQTITVSGVNNDKDDIGNKRDVEVTHTAVSTDSNYNGISIADQDVDVIDDDANNRPKFADDTASAYEFAENTAATTAVTTFSASDIDDQDSITGYSLSGTDAGKFEITNAGALTFKASPDYESPTDNGTNNVYNLTVRVNSGDSSATPSRALNRTLAITVTVTNVDEPPGFPTGATAQSVTEDVAFSYTAPAATDPEGATVTYAATKTDGTALPSWLSFNATTRAFSGTPREADTPATLNVRVTATDATSNSGYTDFVLSALEDNDFPEFSSPNTFSLVENTTAVGTAVAADPDHGDSVTGYTVNQDRQGRLFEINSSTGVLSFKAAPNFEAPAGGSAADSNTYTIWLRVTSDAMGGGRQKARTQRVTVTVTDDDTEAPSTPSPSATTTFQSITVTWDEPDNAGPAITGYDVRYKLGTAMSYPTSPQLTVTTLSATITSLTHDTNYNVQVRAKNEEGSSAYSTAITARTKRNVAPEISTTTTDYDVDENSTAVVVTLAASDSDSEDNISGWALSGADAALFSINEGTGALTFKQAPNYEDPKDSGTNNVYDVIATVTGGTGARAMTDSITLEITVDDVAEAPGKPAPPTVSTSTVTSITFVWSPPANTGPPITGYSVGYKTSGAANYTPLTHSGTSTRAEITGLIQNTTYQFQVQATNDEGTGDWSDPGSAQAKAYDTYGFVVNPAEITICEDSGDSACAGKGNTFTISLQKAPTSDVTLKPRFHTVRGSVSPETMTFTSSNWHLPQTITVTAAQDDIAWHDGVTAKVSYIKTTTDTNYRKVSPKRVTVTMYDNDTAGFEIDTNPALAGVQSDDLEVIEGRGPAYEGGLDSYTVKATSQPEPGKVFYVYPRVSSGGGVVGPTVLAFTGRNWKTPQTVWVSGPRDGMYSSPNRVAVVTNSVGASRGSTYGHITEAGSVNVEIEERDAPLRVRPDQINVFPDLTRIFEVRMTTQPTANVTLALASTDTSVATISTSSLTFTPSNWMHFQKVTVTSKALGTAYVGLTGVTTTDSRFTGIALTSVRVPVCVFNFQGYLRAADEAQRNGSWDGVEYCQGIDSYKPADEEENTFSLITPPVFVDEAADQTATVGEVFSYTAPEATPLQGDSVTYAAGLANGSALPAWLAFTASTRTFSGTPGDGDVGALSIKVIATDNADQPGSSETTFTLTVAAAAPQVQGESAPGDSENGNEGGNEPQESNTEPANRAPSFDTGIAITLAVDENSPAGTDVGSPITATDPDEGDKVTYSLTGTDAASFEIGSSTGQITTKTGVTYNYEAKSSYTLAVVASDGKQSNSTPVTVDLNNVNEAPAFAGASASRAAPEHSPAGTSVGTPITATDPDTGDTLTYSLSGTDAASFAIDNTGQITTKAGVHYNYESKSSYSLTVEASDSKLSDSIAVTVNLTDVVETPVTACTTDLGTLSASALYTGKWDDADCKAHHQDSRARYFEFTLSEATDVSVTVTSVADAALYVSKDTPNNGWGTVPGPGYEHRRAVRRDNGKLLHDGPHVATSENDGNTVTLKLEAGTTYTVEAAGASGDFTVSIAPQ